MPTSDFINTQPEKFFHTSRNAELVVVQDRDVVAFVPEMTYFAASSGMKVYKDSGSTILYESSPMETVAKARRVLLWGRLSGNDLVSGMRWVPYTTAAYQQTSAIKPLVEVFAPRVVYDRTSNMIHLWFWTNMKKAYTGTTYDPTQIIPIGDHGGDFEGLGKQQTAKRVLCYTTGRFLRSYVEGGFLTGYKGLSGPGFADATFDLVPIFTLPKILNVTMGGDGPGIVTDGWYAQLGPFQLYADGDKVGVTTGTVNTGGGLLVAAELAPVAVVTGDQFILTINYYGNSTPDTATISKVSSLPTMLSYTATDLAYDGVFTWRIVLGEILANGLYQRWRGGDVLLIKGKTWKKWRVCFMQYVGNTFWHKYNEVTVVNGLDYIVGAETEVVVFVSGPCPTP
jgi:hypothetical protein